MRSGLFVVMRSVFVSKGNTSSLKQPTGGSILNRASTEGSGPGITQSSVFAQMFVFTSCQRNVERALK